MQALAAERLEARYQQDWTLADQLRQQIYDAGWSIIDGNSTFALEPNRAQEPF